MPEINTPEIIKYLTEDNLKLIYSRLNRRYLVVDALPSVNSLEPSDKNVIYVVKETVGETVRYWANVLENDSWKPLGIRQTDLEGKVDKVDAVEGHLVVADKDGNLADADILPGTFVALAFDPDEQIQPHATDIRKIWEAFRSGIPVMLLDNRANGTGLYASLNAAGYTWPAGDKMGERLIEVDENYRPYDAYVQGYYFDGKFYDDGAHTTQIEPANGEVYYDITTDKTYLYRDETFTQVHRFIQFTANELINDEPVWSSRTSTRQVFYRIFEPVGSATANNFEVVYGNSTGANPGDITKKADKVSNAVQGNLAGLDASGNLTDSGAKVSDFATAAQGLKADTALQEHQDISGKANKSEMSIIDVPGDDTKKTIQLMDGLSQNVVVEHQDITGKVDKVSGATSGNFAAFDAYGNLVDSTKKADDFKTKQSAVMDPTASGDAYSFIDSLEQDTNGEIIPTKKTIPDATTSKKGVVQIATEIAVDENDDSSAATPKAVRDAIKSAVASAYHYAGSKTVAELLSSLLVEENEGNVYNIIDSGTTTDEFIEGAGHVIRSGDNVCVCHVSTNTYKFDLLSGFVDLSNYKTKQTAVADPTASGHSLEFIATVSQDTNGEITVEKKTVQDGTTVQKGVVQLEDSYTSTSTTTAATPNSVKGGFDVLDAVKADKVTGASNGDFAGLDDNGNLTDAGVKPSDFIKGVQKNGTDLTPDQNQKVNVVVNDAKLNVKIGSSSAVETFSADASQDSTIEIPVASYDNTSNPTTYSEGLMTGQEKEKLANTDVGAQVNVIEKVQKNGTDLPITNKMVNVPVGTGMLKTKLGSAISATDLFSADSSTDSTLEIPMASANTTGEMPVYTEGLMSGQDKNKLDGIEVGAEENDVETVSIGGGTPIAPTANTTNIDIPMAGYTSGATPTYTDGAMTGQDKKKLDDLKNFSSVVISDGATPDPATTTIVPANHNSALTFKAGTNVTLSAEPSTEPDTIVISATGGGEPVTVSGGKGISVTSTVEPSTGVTDYEVSVSTELGYIGGKSTVNVTASECDAIALQMTDVFDSGNDRFIIQEDQTDNHVYLYALKSVSGQDEANRVDGVNMFTVTFNMNLTRSTIQSGVTQHGFYGLAGIKVLRKHSTVVTIADSTESYAAEVGTASVNLSVTIQNNSGVETNIGGKDYYGYRFVYYGDTPAIDTETQLPIETIDLVSRLTSVEDTIGIVDYSGSSPTYSAGTAIDMTNDVVSLQYNRGLMVNNNNQLEVRLGTGLDYLPDPENPAIITVGIHSDVEEVVQAVNELETTINTTVTTTMNFSDVSDKYDMSADGSSLNTGVLLGYTFTVPLANQLYLDSDDSEWVTKIGVYASQTYMQNYCIIGIYEFDFNQHPVSTTVNSSGYAGYTVPLCDTGRVKLKSGLNEFSIKHMNSLGETELSFKPDCIYYAAIYISKNCGQNLSLAGKTGYSTQFNDSLPVMSMDMCNIGIDLSDSSKTETELDAISFNDFGWWGGGSSGQSAAYHECPNAHRFFMMVRNVKLVQTI